ncbi:MAG TPA: Hsp33 family molecular chaperone HslO [Devosia sp.]|nr:Hsp33 family molecular chaperone HslO [Devosia sp.]
MSLGRSLGLFSLSTYLDAVTHPTSSAAVDTALGFTVPAHHVRGRLVRLSSTLDDVLSAHAYPPAIERLVAEAIVLAALLGSTLKDEGGQLTLQAQTDNGVVSLLVADYKDGAVRGYAKFDADRLVELGDDPSLFGLFGKGFLAITFDMAATGERYQGIVPLEGDSLGQAAEYYFAQSEQIPSLIQIATRHDAGEGCVAAGLLLQHLPEGEVGRERLHVRHEDPEWQSARVLASTLSDAELVDLNLPLDDIAWRLFHDEGEIRATAPHSIVKGCRCNIDHIRDVLGRFGMADREDMADESGVISVDCAFCSRLFAVPVTELA